MYNVKPPLPPTAERDRIYHRVLLDDSGSTFNFFTANPSGGEAVQNYDQMPLATNKNTVFLGIKVTPTISVIYDDGTIDPAKVVNAFTDGVIKGLTNQRNRTEFRYPITDVLNLNGVQPAGFYDGNNTENRMAFTIPATGFRAMDDIFYVEDNEVWGIDMVFNNANFPAQGDWPDTKFGLTTEIPVAYMTDDELQKYENRWVRDHGY